MRVQRLAVTIAALLILFCVEIRLARADGARDNVADSVRPVPPSGNELLQADRDSLQSGVDTLGKEILSLRESLKSTPDRLTYLPDVIIYYNAVRYPLTYHETIDPAQGQKAIAEGLERARSLRAGTTPWTGRSGARGYVSRIDDSVQPYVIDLPAGYNAGEKSDKHYRLDVVSHGRDEGLTEIKFVSTFPAQEPDPKGKFVLRLYGRYCNANKFAGEIDAFEAMDEVSKHYPIDRNRILNIGFSMGGAACWQFAVHYPDRWAAASPGAGFSETEEFLRVFQKEDVSNAPWYETTLYHLYDCTDWVANLHNLPTICYAGEIDSQKQASDIMLKAAEAEHVKLDRLIGPKTAHAYEPATKKELDRQLDAIVERGREAVPGHLRFTTYTLRYNRMYWLQVDGLEHHWRPARVEAKLVMDQGASRVEISTQNVTALSLRFPLGQDGRQEPRSLILDGTSLGYMMTSRAERPARFVKEAGKWEIQTELELFPSSVRKRPGLQGPIDDAFMDHFLIVRPTGKPFNEKTGEWVNAELTHAIDHWRKQFRGEPLVKDDRDVTKEDIARGNIVLFGDPSSNSILKQMADQLPIRWTQADVKLGERSYKSESSVPVMIYPNPLNTTRYVVLNSGFTFREYDYLNNARQTPKLPDYAIIDITVPRTAKSPGGIAAAGFFGERWELLDDDGKRATNSSAR